MSSNFHTLTVKNIQRETADTVSVSFDVPTALKETFKYKHGQYLTLRFDIQGEEERRAYSMSSSPLETDLVVTVKEVSGGKVSPYINRQLKVGDTVDVMPPEGRFQTKLDPEKRQTYYFFGAGSGITPLMSIIKTTLEKEPQSTLHLLYGNRNKASIIFQTQLKELEKRYAGQLTVTHVLSQPEKTKTKGIGGLFSKGKTDWDGHIGRIIPTLVERFLEEHPLRTKEADYFICGPNAMMQSVEGHLKANGIDKKRVHLEYFTVESADKHTVSNDTTFSSAKVKVDLDGQQLEIDVPADKNILAVMLEQKLDPPYSCTSGACSSCMAKVVSGKTAMEVCLALDEEEVAEGYILTCQAHPKTPEVHITFDV
ncbi:MAG: ferredoxin--NADP reductase [Saprospiraceae bacterium]